jgi:hypothetical protein
VTRACVWSWLEPGYGRRELKLKGTRMAESEHESLELEWKQANIRQKAGREDDTYMRSHREHFGPTRSFLSAR